MIVGFTGSRFGMSGDQNKRVLGLLECLGSVGRHMSGLHGDCVGADEEFNELCTTLEWRTACRPCTFENLRANCADAISKPVRPMERNRALVADADVMIACPPNDEEIKSGSGTWATIRFTRRAEKPLAIVYPNGTVTIDRAGRFFPAIVQEKR